MPNFFEDDCTGSTIITREEVLLPDYLPEGLVHRDRELKTIADALKPLLKKRDCDNLFIHGRSGTGKTSCVKFLLKQLSEHSPNVLPVYVNCWENPTKASVYNRIIEAMELPLPRRGLGADELFDRVLQYIRNYSKPVLLVLDEVDGLTHQDLLYLIARANEKPGILFGIIGISNNPAFLSRLDPRTRSSLRFSELEFREYSEDQLFAILKDRASLGLASTGWDERLLRKIAKNVDDGSARIALERLWKAAKHAERLNHTRISLQDLADSDEKEEIRPGSKPTELEQMIVAKLEEGEKNTSELYESLEMDKSKRRFLNYLKQLERKGIIEISEQPAAGGEEKFRPRICRLK
jgi:cell division control protein 6